MKDPGINSRPIKFLSILLFLIPFCYILNRTSISSISSLHAAYYSTIISRNMTFHPITIVTGYFPLNKSKHSLPEYNSWMKNFLSNVETPMIIYTVPSMMSNLSKLRRGYPTAFQLYTDVWNLPPVLNMKEVFHKEHKIDPNNALHAPELYGIWNSKPWMVVNAAMNTNHFKSSYFFWVDAGSFRNNNHNFKLWPNLERVRSVFGRPERNIYQIFGIRKFNNVSQVEFMKTEMIKQKIIGGFFGGTVTGVESFSKYYYKVLEDFRRKQIFTGVEQDLMNYMATHYHIEDRSGAEVVATCSCDQKPWGGCLDEWFYFQIWYAKEEERPQGCTMLTANVTDARDFHY